MSQPAARVGDMHTCPMSDGPKPHVGGPILPPGVPTVLIGGMPAATITNMCTCVSPAPDTIVKGAMMVLIGGKPAARLGDSTAHGGIIVAGCPTVLIGDGGGGAGGTLTPSSMANGGSRTSADQPVKCDPGTPEARKEMATAFYRENTDWSDARIESHVQAIDLSQPIEVVEIPKDKSLSQWQAPGGSKGNYFAVPHTEPTQLGISPNVADKFNANKRRPKRETIFKTQEPTLALKSTAKPVQDTWSESIQGPETKNSFVMVRSVETKGGATQYFVPKNNTIT